MNRFKSKHTMKENIAPAILTKKDFLQIEECHCGKSPFRYHNTSRNIMVAKCSLPTEEYDTKQKKSVLAKKQPCNFYCVYYGERPIFEEIKNKLITTAQKIPDRNKALEEKLKLLFSFVFVSNHTSTLDEINILVENNLRKEPRKTYYFPCIGNLRVSHYESLGDYRDRIFSEKIVDYGYMPKTIKKEKPTVFIDLQKILGLPAFAPEEPKTPEPPKPKKVVTTKVTTKIGSKFIVVSDESSSENDSDNESDKLSDYSCDLETDEIDEIEETEETEETDEIEEIEEIEETEDHYDDYDEGGEYDDYD